MVAITSALLPTQTLPARTIKLTLPPFLPDI